MAQKEYYEPNIGELGFGIPGAGEGIETLIEDYIVPTWKSYDELENPYLSRTADAFKILPNAAYDAGKFLVDVGADFGQAGIEGIKSIYNKDPLLSTEQGLRKDAFLHKMLGDFSWYNPKDNPFANEKLMRKYRNEAGDRAWDYILKPEDEGGFMDNKKVNQIWNAVDRKVPWEEWATENPSGDIEDFKQLQWDAFVDETSLRYGNNITDYMNKDIDRSLLLEHGIGSDKGGLGQMVDQFDLMDYGMEGNPLFKYSTPLAQKNLGIGQLIPEIFMGYGLAKPAIRQVGKIPQYIREARDMRKGIMKNKDRYKR